MKIAFCSDSHDNMANIKQLIKSVIDREIDYVIHLGDFVAPFAIQPFVELKNFTGIMGNNDGEVIRLNEIAEGKLKKGPVEIVLDGKSFLLMHEPFALKKLSKQFDYVCYGHTHHAEITKTERGAIINPGELCGYLTDTASWVSLDTETFELRLVSPI